MDDALRGGGLTARTGNRGDLQLRCAGCVVPTAGRDRVDAGLSSPAAQHRCARGAHSVPDCAPQLRVRGGEARTPGETSSRLRDHEPACLGWLDRLLSAGIVWSIGVQWYL